MTSAYDWERSAACRRPGADPDSWYPTTGQAGDPATAVCWACPARLDCLEAALAEEDPANPGRVRRWGIRGGLGPAERDQLHRRTARATTATPTN